LTPWIYQLQGGRETFNFAAYGLQQIPDLSFGSPAWSPDGSYLAWVVGGDLSGSGQWEAGIANFDLDNQTVQILNPYAPASCQFAWCFSAPVWSPDGMWLAWNGFPRDIPPGFWVMRPDGNDATYITDGGSPTWSPDGSLVAFNKLTGITVMEVGSWRPQSSGLPTGNMVIEWLNPEDVTMLKD
jgi:Tol biopolymer transport system component